MKTLIVAACLALSGCGTMSTLFTPAGSIPVSQALSPQAQAAQTAINEGNVLLISFNKTVGQQKVDGIITAAERDAYLDTSDGYGKNLDDAQKALRSGDILSATNQAEMVKRLVIALHRKAAEAARAP